MAFLVHCFSEVEIGQEISIRSDLTLLDVLVIQKVLATGSKYNCAY